MVYLRGMLLRASLVFVFVSITTATEITTVHAQSDTEVEADFSAEEAASLEAAARTLFEAGRTAYSEARFEEALDRFERAYAVSQRSLLLYNIAQTQERLRQDAEAMRTFERFLASDPPEDIRTLAERRLARLRASLAPPPEEVAEQAIQVEPDEPPPSNTGLIVGVTIGAVVAVAVAVLVIVLVTRDDGEVQGTIGDVVRTLRAPQ